MTAVPIDVDVWDTDEHLPGDPTPLKARKLPPRDAFARMPEPKPEPSPKPVKPKRRVTPPDPLVTTTRAHNLAVQRVAELEGRIAELEAQLAEAQAVVDAVRGVVAA